MYLIKRISNIFNVIGAIKSNMSCGDSVPSSLPTRMHVTSVTLRYEASGMKQSCLVYSGGAALRIVPKKCLPIN